MPEKHKTLKERLIEDYGYEHYYHERSFAIFCLSILISLLAGFATGISFTLKHCGYSWASLWASFLNGL